MRVFPSNWILSLLILTRNVCYLRIRLLLKSIWMHKNFNNLLRKNVIIRKWSFEVTCGAVGQLWFAFEVGLMTTKGKKQVWCIKCLMGFIVVLFMVLLIIKSSLDEKKDNYFVVKVETVEDHCGNLCSKLDVDNFPKKKITQNPNH